jgi:hypothetical protein
MLLTQILSMGLMYAQRTEMDRPSPPNHVTKSDDEPENYDETPIPLRGRPDDQN